MPFRPPAHRGPGWRPPEVREKERQAALDKRRPNARARGYDSLWNEFRRRYLADNPWCVECERLGFRTAATDVDHVIPVRERPDLRLDPANVRSMCHPHHSARTAREQGFAQPGRRRF